MLKNLDTELDRQGVTRMVVSSETVITEAVTLQQPDPHRAAFLTKDDEAWDWRALRDYVVAEIEARFGAFPRDAKKEFGIFDGFVRRWGAGAAAIARHAFDHADGRWRGAPISINRFCKNADPYFGVPIAERLGLEIATSDSN
jgi:hypothetical protein